MFPKVEIVGNYPQRNQNFINDILFSSTGEKEILQQYLLPQSSSPKIKFVSFHCSKSWLAIVEDENTLVIWDWVTKSNVFSHSLTTLREYHVEYSRWYYTLNNSFVHPMVGKDNNSINRNSPRGNYNKSNVGDLHNPICSSNPRLMGTFNVGSTSGNRTHSMQSSDSSKSTGTIIESYSINNATPSNAQLQFNNSSSSETLGDIKQILFFDMETISNKLNIAPIFPSTSTYTAPNWLLILSESTYSSTMGIPNMTNLIQSRICAVDLDNQEVRYITWAELENSVPSTIEVIDFFNIAIGCHDGMIRIWDTNKWQLVSTIYGFSKAIVALKLVNPIAHSVSVLNINHQLKESGKKDGNNEKKNHLISIGLEGNIILWKSLPGKGIKSTYDAYLYSYEMMKSDSFYASAKLEGTLNIKFDKDFKIDVCYDALTDILMIWDHSKHLYVWNCIQTTKNNQYNRENLNTVRNNVKNNKASGSSILSVLSKDKGKDREATTACMFLIPLVNQFRLPANIEKKKPLSICPVVHHPEYPIGTYLVVCKDGKTIQVVEEANYDSRSCNDLGHKTLSNKEISQTKFLSLLEELEFISNSFLSKHISIYQICAHPTNIFLYTIITNIGAILINLRRNYSNSLASFEISAKPPLDIALQSTTKSVNALNVIIADSSFANSGVISANLIIDKSDTKWKKLLSPTPFSVNSHDFDSTLPTGLLQNVQKIDCSGLLKSNPYMRLNPRIIPSLSGNFVCLFYASLRAYLVVATSTIRKESENNSPITTYHPKEEEILHQGTALNVAWCGGLTKKILEGKEQIVDILGIVQEGQEITQKVEKKKTGLFAALGRRHSLDEGEKTFSPRSLEFFNFTLIIKEGSIEYFVKECKITPNIPYNPSGIFGGHPNIIFITNHKDTFDNEHTPSELHVSSKEHSGKEQPPNTGNYRSPLSLKFHRGRFYLLHIMNLEESVDKIPILSLLPISGNMPAPISIEWQNDKPPTRYLKQLDILAFNTYDGRILIYQVDINRKIMTTPESESDLTGVLKLISNIGSSNPVEETPLSLYWYFGCLFYSTNKGVYLTLPLIDSGITIQLAHQTSNLQASDGCRTMYMSPAGENVKEILPYGYDIEEKEDFSEVTYQKLYNSFLPFSYQLSTSPLTIVGVFNGILILHTYGILNHFYTKSSTLHITNASGFYALPLTHPTVKMMLLSGANQIKKAIRWGRLLEPQYHDDVLIHIIDPFKNCDAIKMALSILPGISLNLCVSFCIQYDFVKHLKTILLGPSLSNNTNNGDESSDSPTSSQDNNIIWVLDKLDNSKEIDPLGIGYLSNISSSLIDEVESFYTMMPKNLVHICLFFVKHNELKILKTIIRVLRLNGRSMEAAYVTHLTGDVLLALKTYSECGRFSEAIQIQKGVLGGVKHLEEDPYGFEVWKSSVTGTFDHEDASVKNNTQRLYRLNLS